MITIIIVCLFAEKLAPDADGSSIMRLAAFEGLFDALAVAILIAIIRQALAGG